MSFFQRQSSNPLQNQSPSIFHIIFYLYCTKMADQFNFEEVVQPDWLNENSRFTDKHMQTHSQVSKDHFFDQLFEQESDNHNNFQNKNSMQQKERNKHNAKNYRDRKKMHVQTMKKQMEHLCRENALLKSQKYCRWCKRSFQHNVLIPTGTTEKKEKSIHQNCHHYQKDMDVQFQKPNLFSGLKKQKNPKIWIALGILMLVLGLTMHGLSGDKTYISKIELEKDQINKWVSLIKQQDKGEYFQVSMRLKEQQLSKRQHDSVSLQFRSPSQRTLEQKQQKISFNKQLLFGIHAQLDDIGVYL